MVCLLSFTYSRYTDNVKRGKPKYQIQIKEEDKHEKDTCIDFDLSLIHISEP